MKKIVIIACAIIVVIVAGIIASNIYSDRQKNHNDVTIGLVMNGSATDRSWGQSHYEALKKTSDELGVQLIHKENVPDAELEVVVDGLVKDGCEIIVCNSFGFGEYLDEVSKKYPDIYFFHTSGVNPSENVTTFFGRIYQMRYLTGIVAGLQTETNEIGYVAAFPIDEVNRGINAFTIGVRSVNPDAKVYVQWTESWTDDESARKATTNLLTNHNIDVMTLHTDSNVPLDVADENGVMCIGYNYDNAEIYPDTFLTAAVWTWDNFYTPHITQCLDNKFDGRNYWDGVNTGIESYAPLTNNVKSGTKEKVEAEMERLRSGTYDVFFGPVIDTEGNVRIAEGESMTDAAMLNDFDWYVEGVVLNEE